MAERSYIAVRSYVTLNCGIASALGLGLGFGLAIAFAFNSTFRFFPGFIILEVGW